MELNFRPAMGKGGIGFVVRDYSGNMVAGGAKPLSGIFSAEHAEVLACCMFRSGFCHWARFQSCDH